MEVAQEPIAKVCSGEENVGLCHWGPDLSRAEASPHMEAIDLTSLALTGNRNRQCDGERIYIHEVRAFWNFKSRN